MTFDINTGLISRNNIFQIAQTMNNIPRLNTKW